MSSQGWEEVWKEEPELSDRQPGTMVAQDKVAT